MNKNNKTKFLMLSFFLVFNTTSCTPYIYNFLFSKKSDRSIDSSSESPSSGGANQPPSNQNPTPSTPPASSTVSTLFENFIYGSSNSETGKAFFWKNGQINYINDPTQIQMQSTGGLNSFGINQNYAKSDNYLFTRGSRLSDYAQLFCKNKVCTEYSLINTTDNISYDSIIIDTYLLTISDDLYSFGTADNSTGTDQVYWKNSDLKLLKKSNQNDTFINAYATNLIISKKTSFTDGQHFYVFGRGDTASWSGALYWKDGEIIKLENGTYPSSVSFIYDDYYFSGPDLIIYGSAYDSNTGLREAVYWKNGVIFQPTLNETINQNTMSYKSQTSMSLNGDVYLVGTIDNNSMGDFKPVYLKNGQRHLLPTTEVSSGESLTFASDAVSYIKAIGTDVYIFAEGYNNLSEKRMVYWKNEVLKILPLTDSQNNTYSISQIGISMNDHSVLTNNSEFYIVGNFVNNNGDTVNGYWQNDSLVILNIPVGAFFISNMYKPYFLHDHDFYFFGKQFLNSEIKIAYWKNGILHELPLTDSYGDTVSNLGNDFSPKVNTNSDLFICTSVSVGSVQTIAYWLNDELNILTRPAGGSIFGTCQ